MFGRYRIVRQIGRGGMGAVYEAVHSDLEKRVALKVLLPSTASQNDMIARFEREGRAAAKIRHPNVVDVSDVGVEAGMPFLVMEFLEGEDLSNVLRREGALPVERVAEIMLPVLGAVAAAHALGVVHRDLKPENIFLARLGDGTVVPKVLDFGISKMTEVEGGTALTGSGMMLGTAHYMSPEQAQSTKNVDARSDQFTLGVILYECATGQKAFNGETLFTILRAIVEVNYLRPRLIRTDLPERFEAMLMRAMSGSPGARFSSVAELADELRVFAPAGRTSWAPPVGARSSWVPTLAGSPGAGVVPPDTLSASSRSAASSASKPSRRGLWIAAVLGVIALLALAGGVASTMSDGGSAVSPPVTPVAAPAPPMARAPVAARAPAPAPVRAPVAAHVPPAVPTPAVVPPAAAPPRAVVEPAAVAAVAPSTEPPTPARGHGHGRGNRRPRSGRGGEGSFMPIVR
ncbi:MAG: serine/threonine-protein kinase [Deltaproteobacteria bacterium]|nr:serine/threonine-protein kinase [Myxococcales bacterium]MDP3214761.1 serine/threonine-protein kinase [Deltaproteobacteria bacterium]